MSTAVAVKVIPQAKWERYCDMLLSRIVAEIRRVQCFKSQLEKLRKRISSEVVFPVRGDWSLPGLLTETLYWATIRGPDRRLAELGKQQQKGRRGYQRSLDVFAQEPGIVAAQLRHLGQRVRTMRVLPGGTEAAILQCEWEWMRLTRHAGGIIWHVEEAACYATKIHACADELERESLAAELQWLIEKHADTIEWHFIQSQPFPDEKH